MKAVNNAGVITFYQSLPNSFRSSTGLHLNVKGWSNQDMKDNGLFDVIIDDNYDERIHDLGEIYWDTGATVFRKDKQPIILYRRGRVLIHARDEAHRFVNTFHRKRRKASKMVDPLEKVPGLGAKKFQTLIRHFGGRKEVLHASEKDIKTVPGIGPALARRIFEAIND